MTHPVDPHPVDAGKGNPAPIEFGCATHAGKVRSQNEDRYFAAPEFGVFAVADGMGGHEDGALASATLVEALGSIGAAVSAPDLLARLEDRVLRANATLWSLGRARGATIGSTLAVLLTFDSHFACVWSGDSRVYRVRDGAIAQLSRDHTEARDLVEKGILSPEEAKVWPRRNVITKAVGARPDPELELEHGTLVDGDVFILCSDGLVGDVDDAEILACVLANAPQAACDALLAMTLRRDAADNVTVVVLRSGVAPGAARTAAPTRRASETVVVPPNPPPAGGGAP
ncbi:PP2C family protein-serine/threonine phosphatase [Methylobacterium sp. J-090]|uniref:PP2C family protein-serine/threonine phosphatase n=1 Tax=Methylobacterium sp. J-090 TaxID=2836666 RepID=UPI001FBA353E|nr:protein phosphatase 2C domain-containing protein [Methylobacterium sp. J-090]MCJ2081703.1 protein phosphatase 2C domain-containing protein [Methylobacterium sp. J-090]